MKLVELKMRNYGKADLAKGTACSRAHGAPRKGA